MVAMKDFLIFSVQDGSFIILARIKIPELQLLLDRQFPSSIHIGLKFLSASAFKQCYHNTTKSDGKSNSVFCKGEKKDRKQDMKEELPNRKQ